MIQLKVIHIVAVAVSVMVGCHGDYHHGDDYTYYANYYPEYSFNYSAPTISNRHKRIFSDEIFYGIRTSTSKVLVSCSANNVMYCPSLGNAYLSSVSLITFLMLNM